MKRIAIGLKDLCIAAGLLGCMLPTALASPRKGAGAVKYKAHCGMVYSAADAKKYHYVCPMDHKPLVKMTSNTAHKKAMKGGAMHGMKM